MKSEKSRRLYVAIAAIFLFFFTSNANATCASQNNENQCEREGYCAWDADAGVCKTGPQQDLCYQAPTTECALPDILSLLLGTVTGLLDGAGVAYNVVNGVVYFACDVVDIVRPLVNTLGISIIQKDTIPIMHTNDDATLTNVQVFADNSLLGALVSLGNFCGVDNTAGNCHRESAIALNLGYLGLLDVLTDGIVYDMPDMPVADVNHSIFAVTTVNVDIDALLGNASQPLLYGSYTKNGEDFGGVLRYCGSGGGSTGGFDASAFVDVVDNYSNDPGSYTDTETGPDIKTKISGKPGYSFEAVYLGTAGGTTPTLYTPQAGRWNNLPISVQFTLTDPTCNPENEFYWGGENKTGVAEIYAGSAYGVMLELSNDTYQTLQAPAIASAQTRLLIRAIDWNAQFNAFDVGNSCHHSSTQGNLCGVIACLGSATQAEAAFPVNTDDSGTNATHRRIMSECYGFSTNNNNTDDEKDDWVEIPTSGSIPTDRACNVNNYNGSCGGLQNNAVINPSKYEHALGCLACILGTDQIPDCAEDLFAIRPDKYDVNITAGEVLIGGTPESFRFRASDYNTTAELVGTQYYNEVEGSSFDINVTISDATRVCPQTNINMSPNVVFENGLEDGNFTFDNIGDVNLTIAEHNTSEFAVIDNDDTPDEDRFITPFKVQFRLIPDHFDVNASLFDFGSNFTYLHDINLSHDYNISTATLEINISSKGANSATMTNYIDSCYAKDTNITLQTSGTQVVPADALHYFLYYNPVTNELNASHLDTATGSITSLPINNLTTSFPPNAPDGNGTTHIEYKLNFDRKVNSPVDPIRISLTNVDVIDTDSVTGSDTANDTATFLYGRAHAPRYRVDCSSSTGDCASQPLLIYFEFYSKDSNLPLRQSIASDLQRSTDAILWFRNANHAATDGNTTSVTQRYIASSPISESVITHGNIDRQTYTYSGNDGYPYKASMELNASRWLIYNRFDDNATSNNFQLEFNAGPGNKAGTDNLGGGADTGAGANTNRRIRW